MVATPRYLMTQCTDVVEQEWHAKGWGKIRVEMSQQFGTAPASSCNARGDNGLKVHLNSYKVVLKIII